jgi:NAD(P)-dependent dehydrogenase (short-subunit alcohol dehydrogenase family)
VKIVLTGHTGGIGNAIYAKFAERGDAVYGFSLPADITDRTEVAKFAGVVRWMAHGQIDALINCIGMYGAIDNVVDVDIEEWVKTLEVNLVGTVLMCKHFIPMLTGGHPKIINFGGAGDKPIPAYSAYAASKSAVVRFTECLKEELKGKIDVYAMAPGFRATGFHDATLKAGPKDSWVYEYTMEKLRVASAPDEVAIAVERILCPEFKTDKTLLSASAIAA